MYLLLLIIPITLSKRIDITTVNNEFGYTLFKTEKQPIIDSYTKILHLINLEEYETIINKLKLNVQTLNLTDSGAYNLLNRELILARYSLNTIVPYVHKNRRNRRGLIDLGGKALKFLVGTMDNEDAVEIYNHLNNLDQNTKQITDQVNTQVIINNELIKNLNHVAEHVNKQQTELNKFLANLTTKINSAEKFKFILQIYADINLINRQLEKLTDIILTSRLNILPHDILTEQEKEKYNITLAILPFIKTHILYINTTLIFTISIPNFTYESYYKALIIPFPNDDEEELDHKVEEVIVQGDRVYAFDENLVVKKDLKLHENKCIANVLKINNVCKLRFNNVSSIEEISDGLVVTKNLKITNLTQNCIDQKIMIKNNNILKFSDCKIQIDNFVFRNKLEKYLDSAILPITHINFTKVFDNLSLEKLNIDNIKNREEIEYIKSKHNFSIGVSISTITIIIIISIFICKLKFCKNKKKETVIEKVELNDKKNKNTDPFAGTANTLSGGGVTQS